MQQMVFKYNRQTQLVIIINALFLILLLVLGKADPMAIVFAYVFETIIIGVFHFVKLFFIAVSNKYQDLSAKFFSYFGTFFFLFHFGGFVAIQSLIIYTAFAIKDNRFSTSLRLSNFTDLFYLEGFEIIALSVIIAHIASFYFSFLMTKKYKHTTVDLYMVKPYIRIFIQQFLAIIPLFFLYFTDKVGIVAAILLIAMRAILDLVFSYIAQSPAHINVLAQKIVSKEKPQELPEIEASLKTFFEE